MITFVLRSWTVLLLFMTAVNAIQNGSTIRDASWYPFYVMLGNPHVCGGILLTYNPATILTAAHCVADAKPPPAGKSSPFFVGYKAAERAKHTYNPIEDWVTHPAYVINDNGDVDMHYDMAIVKLAHPIEPSKHLNRVALWPANKTLPQYTRGSLMGFGYTGIDEPEADILQRTTLGVTQFSPGTSNMVEAVASHDDSLACHGDSGSPLVVHEVMHSNNTAVLVPRVLGLLARIFGVHDVNEERATCPTPFESNTTQPSIIESFCNLSNVLPWISNETGLTVDELTDPFYEPCYGKACPFTGGHWLPSAKEKSDADAERWHIGFADANYDRTHPTKWWIGPVFQNRLITPLASAAERPEVAQWLFYGVLVCMSLLY